MWLDSKAVNCPQKWGNFTHKFGRNINSAAPPCIVPREGKDCNNALQCHHGPQWSR